MDELRNTFHEDIKKMGIPEDMLGEKILYYAMDILADDPILLCCVSKQVYPDISDKMNTNPICVERNLRTFIGKLWNADEHKYLDMIAGRTLKKKPTNRQFLDMMRYYWYERDWE